MTDLFQDIAILVLAFTLVVMNRTIGRIMRLIEKL